MSSKILKSLILSKIILDSSHFKFNQVSISSFPHIFHINFEFIHCLIIPKPSFIVVLFLAVMTFISVLPRNDKDFFNQFSNKTLLMSTKVIFIFTFLLEYQNLLVLYINYTRFLLFFSHRKIIYFHFHPF